MDSRDIGRRIELLAGVGLVVFGGLFAIAELGGDRGWSLVWPLFVVVPGLLFFAAMVSFGRQAGFLAIPGAIIVVSGLLLLLTNTFGNWQAWSYLWALVTPGAVGLGLWVYGVWGRQPTLRRIGAWIAYLGVVLFAVFGAVFELLLGVSGPLGREVGRFVWPIAIIILGAWLVIMQAVRPRHG